ncbi:ABC-F family ATP-binding cassette domain-containing protein [Veillonella sp. AS16]|uniref:ABC-F family ATP-binding cassette domain-containing protein n=1 Tax=Veillonella sp. AS16 TaxID=936589 RepID=UPI000571F6D2|nr:ABC-F family ATP-binding cassette domain-containing protein [Veillonella sp. AS16]
MSVLTVSHVTHGFGARQILDDASFRLLKGEHVGLIGANGEGKSTFLNIITGKLPPDEGKIEWSNQVTVGYLDQHAVLEKGMTIRDVLQKAFDDLFVMEQNINDAYNRMGDVSEDEMNKLLEQVGEWQEILEQRGFYEIDAVIERTASGLGLMDIGLDRDVTELSGGQRTKVLLTKLLLEKPTILLLDEPTNYLDVEHIHWLQNYLQNYENAFILISHDMEFLNSVVNVIYHIEQAVLTRYTGDYHQFQAAYEVKKAQAQKAYERQQQEIERMEDFIQRNKARVATRGMANSRAKRLEKMEILEKPKEYIKPSFGFKEGRTPSRFIVEAFGLEIGYDAPSNSETALDYIWNEYPAMTNAEVRAALARCGLTNEHITSQMRVLSGGENAKVRLCKLMQNKYNVLVLDEPTNHLDVYAKEELSRALRAFKGTIVLVSHEPEFYNGWVTDIWNIEDWTTKIV